jgi:hypothetical protein
LKEETPVRYVTLEEDIARGQRVEYFMLQKLDEFGRMRPFYHGTTIGNRRICDLGEKMMLKEFEVRILSSRDRPEDLKITLT